MQHGIGELFCFKAGNNQWFILFRVAGKGQWHTSQVNDLLDKLGLETAPYMDHPMIMGFAHNDMHKHDFVKLIKRAVSTGQQNCIHWKSDSTLVVNWNKPIVAPRERKAPQRFKPVTEPKKPRRKVHTPEKINTKRFQRVADTESDEDEVPVSQPSDVHMALFQSSQTEAERAALNMPAIALPSVVAAEPAVVVASHAMAADPSADLPVVELPVVQAVYMPNFAAVYSEESKSAEVKRLEAHLADKDKHLADKDKQLADKDKHLADKDKYLTDKDELIAAKDKALKAALAALQALSSL